MYSTFEGVTSSASLVAVILLDVVVPPKDLVISTLSPVSLINENLRFPCVAGASLNIISDANLYPVILGIYILADVASVLPTL